MVIMATTMMFYNCRKSGAIKDNNIICRCILSPASVAHDTYLIEVNDSGLITTSFGCLPITVEKKIKKDDEIFQNHITLIENIEKKKSKKLTPSEYEHLIERINNLKADKVENPFVEGWFWDDAWIVVFMTNDRQFIYEKYSRSHKKIDTVVNELVRLSPIPISFDQLVGGIEKIEPSDTLLYQDEEMHHE